MVEIGLSLSRIGHAGTSPFDAQAAAPRCKRPFDLRK
jgi:hypothetical protein